MFLPAASCLTQYTGSLFACRSVRARSAFDIVWNTYIICTYIHVMCASERGRLSNVLRSVRGAAIVLSNRRHHRQIPGIKRITDKSPWHRQTDPWHRPHRIHTHICRATTLWPCPAGLCFVVHGGLSREETTTIDDINSIVRKALYIYMCVYDCVLQ